jgi:hypothetical protein
VVVYVAACYAVLAVEELLAALGRPVQESLLPFGGRAKGTAPQDQTSDPEKPPESSISNCLRAGFWDSGR